MDRNIIITFIIATMSVLIVTQISKCHGQQVKYNTVGNTNVPANIKR